MTTLKAITYVVRGTDVNTGCSGEASLTIENEPTFVAQPLVHVVSNRTDCEVPNGALAITNVVNGMIYEWTNGTDFVYSNEYTNLDVNTYSVRAQDLTSGCYSSPVEQNIIEQYVYPEFELLTEPSLCNEGNGTVELINPNNSDIQIIEWDINGTIFIGPSLTNLEPGTYSVFAISSLHCPSESKTFEIKTEINIYNAVSNNNDGFNDFFEIGCITDFPNNTVRIFNRAGTLVYEGKGYDNENVLFDGISNKGISLLGTELPDGTYFYIIDKGDGSKPRSGYLELLN